MGFLDDIWNGIEDTAKRINPELGNAVKNVGHAGKAIQQVDLNKELEKAWRTVEDSADEADPEIGAFVKGVGKTGKDIQNVFRAQFEGSPIDLWSSKQVSSAELVPGDHLWIHCEVFSHHGLYIGGGEVIHYGKASQNANPTVCRVTLTEFAEEKPLNRKDSLATYSVDAIIVRAKSRLKENSYQLIFNNCEHFVTWCRSGD